MTNSPTNNTAARATRPRSPITAALLLLTAFTTAAHAQPAPGEPDFLQWDSNNSGSYFNYNVTFPASNWISFNYFPFVDGGEPQPEGLLPSQIDFVYFDSQCEPGPAVGIGCGDAIEIDMFEQVMDMDPQPKLFVGGIDVGSGDWVFDFADGDIDVNGYVDGEDQQPGELYVGSTPEISARLSLYPGNAATTPQQISTDNGYLGLDPQAHGTVVVDFLTEWINVERDNLPGSGHLGVGYSGFGVLDITDGGYVLTRQAVVGGGFEVDPFDTFEMGSGHVKIGSFLPNTFGTSRLDVQEKLWVGGFTGTARVDVNSGGHLAVGGDLQITGDDTFNILDPARIVQVNTGGSVYVGDETLIFDQGELLIDGGYVQTHGLDFRQGTANSDGYVFLFEGTLEIIEGFYKSPTDELKIDSVGPGKFAHMIFSSGALNLDIFNSGIVVGDSNNGSLTIRTGSFVDGHDMNVATTTANSSGTVGIQSSAVLNLTGSLRISGNYDPDTMLGTQGGTGWFGVHDGGSANITEDVYIGYTVEDVEDMQDPDHPHRFVRSTLTVGTNGRLLVGDAIDNHGEMFISDDGRITAANVFNRSLIDIDTGGELVVNNSLFNSSLGEGGNTGEILFSNASLLNDTATSSLTTDEPTGTISGMGTISNFSGTTIRVKNARALISTIVDNYSGADIIIEDFGKATFTNDVNNLSGAAIRLNDFAEVTFTGPVNHHEGAIFHVRPGSLARFEGDLNASGHFLDFGPVVIAGNFSRIDGSPFDRTYFGGDLDIEDTARIRLGLIGTNNIIDNPGLDPQYDWLDARLGVVTLDGALEVNLYNGFVPEIGDQFFLIEGITVTGEFDTLDLPDLGTVVEWDLEYLTDFYEDGDGNFIDTVRLTLREPVPEPTTLAVFAIFGLLATRRSHRCRATISR